MSDPENMTIGGLPAFFDPVGKFQRWQSCRPDDDIGGSDGREVPQIDPDIDLTVRASPAVMNMAEELNGPLPRPVPTQQWVMTKDETLRPVLHLGEVMNAGPGQGFDLRIVMIAANEVLAARQSCQKR